VIANGRIVFSGTPAELQATRDPLVLQFLRGEPDGPIAFDSGAAFDTGARAAAALRPAPAALGSGPA